MSLDPGQVERARNLRDPQRPAGRSYELAGVGRQRLQPPPDQPVRDGALRPSARTCRPRSATGASATTPTSASTCSWTGFRQALGPSTGRHHHQAWLTSPPPSPLRLPGKPGQVQFPWNFLPYGTGCYPAPCPVELDFSRPDNWYQPTILLLLAYLFTRYSQTSRSSQKRTIRLQNGHCIIA